MNEHGAVEMTPQLAVHLAGPDKLVVEASGNWRGGGVLAGSQQIEQALGKAETVKVLELDGSKLGDWDSRFVTFVVKCHDLCQEKGLEFRPRNLPDGVLGLIRLAEKVPEKKDTGRAQAKEPLLHRVGDQAIGGWDGIRQMLSFLGQLALAFIKLPRGKAQFQWSDAWLQIEQCGPQALGIVALINFLVGLILAFVGVITLRQFGASIFVADMVAIATVREMGCLMTGIILCGRTGAAFAAQLGTMKVNEEITALQGFGISPMEFLVLPRTVALVLMMPLLCVYANLIAILGGFMVATSLLDISSTQYFLRTINAITATTFMLGIVKGTVFGFLVAYAGCLRGMQCGRNAAAVGDATTRAVVAGITAIIASDGIFAVICNALNI